MSSFTVLKPTRVQKQKKPDNQDTDVEMEDAGERAKKTQIRDVEVFGGAVIPACRTEVGKRRKLVANPKQYCEVSPFDRASLLAYTNSMIDPMGSRCH